MKFYIVKKEISILLLQISALNTIEHVLFSKFPAIFIITKAQIKRAYLLTKLNICSVLNYDNEDVTSEEYSRCKRSGKF